MTNEELINQGQSEIAVMIRDIAKDLHIKIAEIEWWHSTSPGVNYYEVAIKTDSERLADQDFTKEQLMGFTHDNKLLTQVKMKMESIRIQLQG